MAYLHISAPCPTGWGYNPEDTVKIAKLAVETGLWNLYEIECGKIKITKRIAEKKPIDEYIKMQKRFRGIKDEEKKMLMESIALGIKELEQMEKI